MTQLFTSQEMKGRHYSCLKNTYTILIANFTMFGDDKEYHDFKMEADGLCLSELLHIIVVELPKTKELAVSDMSAM